ncbi:MAG TPA: NAD(P)/FAD-dependent oxidoreductase [Terriglobia bacterium]|nr:NAD(P)/FAD-dependent oxidoreductase [Terriglobia bacterium]
MEYDAIVIGSGPNGLAAAIELARAGLSVCVFEKNDSIGGGAQSSCLTIPGFIHDICSAIHPLGLASPFFRTLPLADFGLEWIQPEAPLAHPFVDGSSVFAERSVVETARMLGADSVKYQKLFGKLVQNWDSVITEILAPVHIPAHPLLLARFGWQAMRSARAFAYAHFREERARALFAGMAGHSLLPLEDRPSAAFGLVLTLLAHAVGWPLARGGSQQISEALGACLRSLGGRIVTGVCVRSLDELPSSRLVLCDVTPRQLLEIAGRSLVDRYRHKLQKYRYGSGVFKIDWALSSPIPWKDSRCARAATVHIGGTFEAIAAAENDVARGRHPDKPFVLVAQPSLFDSTRTPPGKHTGWAYCHVPNGSTEDMTNRIEAQIEAVAPGFLDCILARHTFTTRQLEAHNPNLVGGDINGGVQNLPQLLARPVLSPSPYRTPIKGLYICSSSTPPGGGVHGMCGFYAARTALADERS